MTNYVNVPAGDLQSNDLGRTIRVVQDDSTVIGVLRVIRHEGYGEKRTQLIVGKFTLTLLSEDRVDLGRLD